MGFTYVAKYGILKNKRKGGRKMLTEFGKAIRKIRLDKGEILKDMAKRKTEEKTCRKNGLIRL